MAPSRARHLDSPGVSSMLDSRQAFGARAHKVFSRDSVRLALRTVTFFEGVDAYVTRGLFVRLARHLSTTETQTILIENWIEAATTAFSIDEEDVDAISALRTMFEIAQLSDSGGVAEVTFEALAVVLACLACGREYPQPVSAVEATANTLWDILTVEDGTDSGGTMSLDALSFVAWQVIKVEARLSAHGTAPARLWAASVAFVERLVKTCGAIDEGMFARWFALGCGAYAPSAALAGPSSAGSGRGAVARAGRSGAARGRVGGSRVVSGASDGSSRETSSRRTMAEKKKRARWARLARKT